MIWTGWPIERLVYIFLGVAYLLVWGQVTLLHWRGGFRSRLMWGPVLATPFLVAAALLMGCHGGAPFDTIYVILFAAGVVEGLVGTLLHARGVGAMVGGFTLRNLMAGPPVLLPAIYMALSAFGLVVYYGPAISGGH